MGCIIFDLRVIFVVYYFSYVIKLKFLKGIINFMSSPYIIWIGNVFKQDDFINNPAISPASNYWQKNAITSIRNLGVEVVIMSYQQARIWPRSSLIVKRINVTEDKSQKWISYLNLPYIKDWVIYRKLTKEALSYINNFDLPLCVVTYNPVFHNRMIGKTLLKKKSIKWVSIWAENEFSSGNFHNLPKAIASAESHIFLAHYAYTSAPYLKKLHFDGGCTEEIKSFIYKEKNPLIFLYTGMFDIWGGVDILVKTFSKLMDDDILLWICGHGKMNPGTLNIIENDPRIKFFGTVPENELEQIMTESHVLVNPRPPSQKGNQMNFPSKILRYLSYGKPVISSKSLGIGPEYSEVLIYEDFENLQAFSNQIKELKSWSRSDWKKHYEKLNQFLKYKKWSVTSKKLLDFLIEET